MSLLRFRGDEQFEVAERVKVEMEEELGERIETDIAAFTDFTLAEERHQKYYVNYPPLNTLSGWLKWGLLDLSLLLLANEN